MTTCLGKSCSSFGFSVSAFRKLLSIYVFSYFPFGFDGRMWDLIVLVPDHCLSFHSSSVTLIWDGWLDAAVSISFLCCFNF